MTVTREDLNPCTVRLNVSLDAPQVKEAFDKALKEISKKVRLPGFRPGHAPKSMVEKVIDPRELYEVAADQIVRSTFEKAVKELGLEPDGGVRPSVELKELDKDKGVAEYTAKVPLPAKIELAEYNGVEVERPSIEVTDEEVAYQIDELRKRRGTREAVTDRGAVEGDIAVVNLKVEGDTGEGKNFMTVVGQTFESLDKALLGMSGEEMKSVELDFPANFQDPALAGKSVKAQITLNSVSAVQMADLDEEFAKSLQTSSVDDLQAKMKQSILDAKTNMANDLVQDQILEKLRAASTIHVSDNMWEALANQRLREIAQEQNEKGRTMEQYAEENGMSLDQLVDAWHEQAKIHVERAMIVREIFAAEKLQISNEELNRELFAMAGEFNLEPAQLLEILRQNDTLVELQFRAISRKVTDFLVENAKVTEVSGDAAAAPAKPAAKKKAAKAADAEEAPAEEAAAEAKPKKAPAKKKKED